MRNEVDVVVIGAGAAGLAAAGELVRAGRSVQVLEARDRMGGRILTLRQPGLELPLELGAEFVHGEDAATMRFAREAGLLVCEVDGEHWRARDGRLERVKGFWEKIEEAMSRLDPRRSPDRSVREALADVAADFADDDRRLLLEYVQGFHAADADRMGEQALAAAEGAGDEESGADRQLRIPSGYDRVVAQLALAVPGRVTLNAVVQRIDWQPGRVVVVAHSSERETLTVRARATVITVPLGVLQARVGEPGAIALDPDVPRIRRAAARLAMGSVLRVVLRLREAVWMTGEVRGSDGSLLARLSFLHADAKIPVWWTPAPILAPVIVGWCGGPPARELARLTGSELERLATATLAEQFRMKADDLRHRVVSFAWHDWEHDPYSRGAYSYVPVGCMDAQETLAEPESDTLFFAGEALAHGDPGTVHGAIESGIAAARRLIG